MPNFKSQILAVAGDEPIEAIVIGRLRWQDGKEFPEQYTVMQWEDAASILDYDFDDGYGGAECHPITAWTATRVIFVREYDGSTSTDSIPRHPIDHQPDYT